MKNIFVALVVTLFASVAFAAEGTVPAQGASSNTDTTVVHKAKKTKKKGKKSKKSKAAPAEAAPAAPAEAAPAGH